MPQLGLSVGLGCASRTLGATSFSPSSLSGLRLWLETSLSSSTLDVTGADVEVEGTVITWKDLSGNGFDAVKVNGYPLKQGDGVEFDGSSAFATPPIFTTTQSETTPVTYIANISADSTFPVSGTELFGNSKGLIVSTKSYVSSMGATATGLETGLTTSPFYYSPKWGAVIGKPYTGEQNFGTTAIPATPTAAVLGLSVNPSSSGNAYFYLNGSLNASSSITNYGATPINQGLIIGAGFEQDYKFFTSCKIRELLVYDRALSGAEISAISAYLLAKYPNL